jgi:hypothetical protein
MARVLKRGPRSAPKFYVQFDRGRTPDGKRLRCTRLLKGVENLPQARQAAARVEREIAARNRIPRQPHLARHLPHGAALHPNFVPDYVNLIHPEHPHPAERPTTMAGKLPWSPGWITFRAAGGSLSGRRDHSYRRHRP